MKKFVSIPLVALALAAGCRDAIEQPGAPTVADRITAPSLSAAVEDGGDTGTPTVCTGYRAELERAQAAEDAEAVAALESIIADACN